MLHGIDIVDTRTFYLCELILCVSEGMTSMLLGNHNVGMETFDLHVQILCVSEVRRLDFRVALYLHCGHGILPSWTDYVIEDLSVFYVCHEMNEDRPWCRPLLVAI